MEEKRIPNHLKSDIMKHFSRNLMMAVALAIIAMQVNAAPVDADAAQSLASQCLQSKAHGMMMSPQATLQLVHAEKSSCNASRVDYYVFNSDEDAYVIVSGDDRTAGILGYGQGCLDMVHLPCNMQWWLDQYKKQMDWLIAHPQAKVGNVSHRSPADGLTIEPLLTCKWSQLEPYYNQCPEYPDEGRCVTGCVATAMAQVMYYWKYPEALPAVPGYTFNYFNLYHYELEQLPGTVLDWENMLDKYSRGYTAEQADAVATLMRYCGQACFMEYSPEGSSSSDLNQLMAFKAFGYNPSARTLLRDECDADEWVAMVVAELQAGHPIAYSGRGDSGGHAFVIDGCSDGKFHVNWGWAGSYDGYFELDVLKVPSYNFSYEQGMNYGICPDDGNAPELEAAYDFEVDGIYYLKNGDQATVSYKDECFNSYSGVVDIPSEVEWEGKTYQVTAVGKYAFAYCPSLTAVRLPSIRTIKKQAFDACTSLEELKIGPCIESLEISYLYSCPKLKWIDVDDLDAWVSLDYEYMSPHAFGIGLHYQGDPVTDLVVHSGHKVGDNSLCTLKSLEHVTFEDGAISVGDYGLWGCENLKTVVFGDGLERIGFAAFYECNDLKSVKFKGHMGRIDDSSFYGLTNLDDVTLPTSVDSIGYAAFAYCDKIPSLEFHDVDHLGDYAFFGCTSLNDVSFLGRVGGTGSFVFSGCSSLSRVNINDLASWCDIQFGAPASNPLYFAGHLCVNDVPVTDLVIPDGVLSIGPYAFAGGREFTNVSIPESLKSIGASAFTECEGMTHVDISDLQLWCGIDFENVMANPLAVAHELHVNQMPITDLVIPEGVQNIGRFAFYGGEGITSVTLPTSMKSVGLSAFNGCNGITRVTAADLPSWCGINFVNNEANPLHMTHRLEVDGVEVADLVVPDSVEAIGDFAFASCEGLLSVAIGDGVKSIGKSAFLKCRNLVTATVGDGVVSIGEMAFNSCTSLTGITLGRGLESIGTKAFSSSMMIGDITCKATNPPVLANKDAFSNGIYKKATVTVPMESLDAYRTAAVWSQFVNIVGGYLNYRKGDVNFDGEVNIADINLLAHKVLTLEGIDEVFDVNDDGEVNIGDVNAVIRIILHEKQ